MEDVGLAILTKFKSGNFDQCIQLFLTKSWHCLLIQNLSNPIDGLTNEIFVNSLEENNILVCKSLDDILRDDVLDNFKAILSSYRSLDGIPPELYLNFIHNLLWWFLVKVKSTILVQLNFKGILNTSLQGLMKVVKLYNKSIVTRLEYLDESTVEILHLSVSVLLHVPGSVSLQLLSVITLVTLLLLRNSPELSVELLTPLKTTVDQLEMLALHMQTVKSNGIEELCFKFGFSEANSTASMKTREEVLEAFVISVSLVCAQNKEYHLTLECLEKIPETKPSKFMFLFSLIKAHCFLHLQKLTEAKVCLAYSNAAPVSPIYQDYYRLLLGQVFSAQGCHQEALTQFQAAMTCPPPLSSLATYQAALQAEILHFSTLHLRYLKQLVQILQETLAKEKGFEGYEDVCLDSLHQHSQVSLSEALYTLSRQSYITGYHMNALDNYTQLLNLVKTSSTTNAKSLPPKLQILQEAALSHVKANSLQDGEALCRQLMQDHVPLTDGGGKWETLLYRMDEDIVSSILLSDILAASDKKKAIDNLNRCYNMVVDGKEQGSLEEGHTMLCDWLLSRTLLRKARLSQGDDSAHYFRRALIHVPGDKEVMYHYKQWALWHPDHQSFDPGDRVCEFPVSEVNNLALRHVLACSVSQEEWDTLFNQDSSQNVLDTLFD